jgi:Rad3-related DNA helicase
VQEEILLNEVLVMQAPVGSGKSAMARAIQKVTRAPIITPSNMLIDQYVEGYPDVNFLKGKAHYNCEDGFTCEDKAEVFNEDPCAGCPYQVSKAQAIGGAPTFFNPLSLYYTSRSEEWQRPSTMIVDEAHMLGSMVLLMAGKRFDGAKYNFDDVKMEVNDVSNWLSVQLKQMTQLANLYAVRGQKKKAVEVEKDRRAIYYILQGLREDSSNYAIWRERGKSRGRYIEYLNIKPITPPEFLVRQLLNAERVILMSGTIFKHDVEELLPGRKYKMIDLPSPLPKENRRIVLDPVDYRMNWQTPPEKIAGTIKSILEKHPGENTIIHVSYALSKKLAPHLPGRIITNTPEDKIQKVEEFKSKGGVFLAAGCAEGLDLKGDLCRVNIIPKLLYPNMKDPVVAKRMERADGSEWYELETLKLLIQQAGRSTRCLDDYSTTYVCDPGALWRIKKHGCQLPKSFLEALDRRT